VGRLPRFLGMVTPAPTMYFAALYRAAKKPLRSDDRRGNLTATGREEGPITTSGFEAGERKHDLDRCKKQGEEIRGTVRMIHL